MVITEMNNRKEINIILSNRRIILYKPILIVLLPLSSKSKRNPLEILEKIQDNAVKKKS
jgi:hypothetical protein